MVLLPKKPGAVDVDAFRPICLQNCCLKILSKILTTRLQAEIPRLIDLYQTGFIRGRSISDTFVYAAELVQVCHKRKKPALVLKLDFAKAFDTVNWEGLFAVLRARRFSEVWIAWIEEILRSSRSAVLVNGCPGPWISCKRGLRQGDPISPYLFLLVAETLQCMIKARGNIRHPTEEGLHCAALQYADDTLIVLRGDVDDATNLRGVLDQFASFSGLKINYDKSTLVPIHMDEQQANLCVQIIGCRREGFPQPYLGLPLSIHKLPVSAFSPYLLKTDRYLGSWQAQFLNPMGRAVLVNYVLDSQLVYLMSSLQLPPAVITSMDKKRRAFLWSGDTTGKASPASCLVAWIAVCMPKEFGGLGIKDLGTHNICLLLKLLHRLHTKSSAWAFWVRGRASISSLRGDVHGDHWEVLRSLLPLYQAITSVVLGNGQSCSFWLDVWIGDEALADSFPALYSHCNKKDATVSEMIQDGLQNSLVPRLSRRAQHELAQTQQMIADTTLSDDSDQRVSPFLNSSNGLDSSAIYCLLKAKGQQKDDRAAFVWKNSAPPRVQMFMWLLLQRRIQCRAVLHKKHVVPNNICEICNSEEETPEHIISGCNLGKLFWEKLNMPNLIGIDMRSLHLTNTNGRVPSEEFSAFIALSCWQLWKARNAAVFRNEVQNINQVFQACKETADQWSFRFKKKKKVIAEKWCHIFQTAMQA
jgi:hypothetical protein